MAKSCRCTNELIKNAVLGWLTSRRDKNWNVQFSIREMANELGVSRYKISQGIEDLLWQKYLKKTWQISWQKRNDGFAVTLNNLKLSNTRPVANSVANSVANFVEKKETKKAPQKEVIPSIIDDTSKPIQTTSAQEPAKTPGSILFDYYKEKYELRFSRMGRTVKILPNAKMRSQCCHIIKQYGLEMALRMVDAYLNSKNKYYMEKLYPLGFVLSDGHKFLVEAQLGENLSDSQIKKITSDWETDEKVMRVVKMCEENERNLATS